MNASFMEQTTKLGEGNTTFLSVRDNCTQLENSHHKPECGSIDQTLLRNITQDFVADIHLEE